MTIMRRLGVRGGCECVQIRGASRLHHRAISQMILILTLLTAAAATESPEPQAVLGKFIHTHGSVHSLNRSALEEELRERGTRWLPTDNDDTLRLRIFDARNRLLDHRNRHVMHAEQVMIEAQQHSTTNLFADANLEALLADDNAIFSDTLRRQMLADLKLRSVGGAVVGFALSQWQPLGRIAFRGAVPSLGTAISRGLAACLVTGSLLGVLQILTTQIRLFVDAPSYFGQKVSAVVCRDGLIQWLTELAEAEEKLAAVRGRALEEEEAAGEGVVTLGMELSPQKLFGLDEWRRRMQLLKRQGCIWPIFLVAAGSSIFEEVLFRGVLLQGLVTKVRLPKFLASALSSIVFGLAHVANEKSVVMRSIYACWTFFGGLLFGGAFLHTRGGLLSPILVHFGNNAVVFTASLFKVADKMIEQRKGYQALLRREKERQAQQVKGSGGVDLGGGGGGAAAAANAGGGGGSAAQAEEVERLKAENARLSSSKAEKSKFFMVPPAEEAAKS